MRQSERGRVPFALLGVLLLVSSATIVVTSQPRTPPTDPAVSRAMERAMAVTQTTLRDAVLTASLKAARSPVIDRANTTAGRALNESSTFRDYLRLRIYLAAQDGLERIVRRRNDVRVTVSLPPVNDVTDIEAVKQRVHVEPADVNATTLSVRIENITLTATRNGRVLTERRISPTLIVATPVLALHARVQAFQRKLDADIVKPGLAQRLTAQLYAIAWARGYAQYAGLPIENVLANRHVAIATNAALLQLQRVTIGQSDSAGRRTLALASMKVAAQDLLIASGAVAPQLQGLLGTSTKPAPNEIRGFEPPTGARPTDEMTIGVNRTADAAFLDLISRGTLNQVITNVYSADVRLIVDIERGQGGLPPIPPRPGQNWTLVDEHRSVVVDADASFTASLTAPGDWHTLETYGRLCTVVRTRKRTWKRDNKTTITSTEATEKIHVSIAVIGRHASGSIAPDRGIKTAHERGMGPLSGPNLADVRHKAVSRLITERGGLEEIIRRALDGRLDTPIVRINANQPDDIYGWIYRDLMHLREQVRNITVSVERRKIGTFEANPPAMLAERIRGLGFDLVDLPATYESTANKAKIAARIAYIDAVLSSLESRARERRERARRFDAALKERGSVSLTDLRASAHAALGPQPDPGLTLSGPVGPVHLRVDSAPSYLTLAEIDSELVPALDDPSHPLVVRNVNVFTIPYSDVSDTILDAIFGSTTRVRLATAAQTLRATNAALDMKTVRRLRKRRDALLTAVESAVDHVRGVVRNTLAARDIGGSKDQRRTIITKGLARWETTAGRALALSNGSASASITAAADKLVSLTVVQRDMLRLTLDRRIRESLSDPAARPKMETVNRSRTVTSKIAREIVNEYVHRKVNQSIGRIANRTFDNLPSGLPLSPVPGYWYATMNVWYVTARGQYARFGVRADRGRPNTPGSGIIYVRDGSVVTLDVDDDGDAERLGRSTRIDFDVSTAIVVVVPPGKGGVGDRDGNADERSRGWPQPG